MIKIYDSFSKKREIFVPLVDNLVRIYLCGPTVYDVAHLGHGRSAVAFDLVRRYFEYLGFQVDFVMNFTDIDDKMINRAKDEELTVAELAKKIIPEYVADYGALGIKPPTHRPKATDYVKQIIFLIEELEKRGAAYVLPDGVYFDVSKFAEYGKLSGQNLEALQVGARVEANELKKNPVDFVLWKFKKENEPFWPSPWGEGRPGWHIECSAMCYGIFGESFDIHAGGLDLKFPHHECEIAQTQMVFGAKSFAKYWLHNGFITINEEKMSKSLGNFFTLRSVFEKYDPMVVRLMYLQTHYRNPINFSFEILDQAASALKRVHTFVRDLRERHCVVGPIDDAVRAALDKLIGDFEGALNEDFDTSGALAALFDFMRFLNHFCLENPLSDSTRELVFGKLQKIDSVLNFIFAEKAEVLDDEILALIEERNVARKNRDFKRSDEIRDFLMSKGVLLEDHKEGVRFKRI